MPPVSTAASPETTTSLCSYWQIHRGTGFNQAAHALSLSSLSLTDTHTNIQNPLSQNSLAPPQGGLHTLSPVSLVVVDERKGQGDIEGVGSARRRRPFPRLERNGEVHPGCRPLGFKALDEVLTKNLAQHCFEGQVNTDGTVRTTWKRETRA